MRARRWLLVFTLAALAGTAQAAPDGQAIYQSQCASCHGDSLAGGAGPALTGPAFTSRWQGKTAALRRFIAEQMPMNKPGSLSSTDAGLLTAYLLAQALPTPSGEAARGPAAAQPGTLPGAPVEYGIPSTQGPGDSELLEAKSGDWLSYNRDTKGQRYAPLDQITTKNAGRLAPKCIFQAGEIGSFQASPVVRHGVMFITTAHHVYALNAATCHALWSYDYQPVGTEFLPSNRGIALYKGMAIRGTLDGHLIALDAANGKLLWDVAVCDTHKGCFINAVPLAFDGRLFVGEAGADVQNTGHVHAFDAATGKPLWTFDLVPTGREPGAGSWGSGAALGGASMWTTISLDPKSRLLYMSVGNPGQDFSGANRPGDNLYTDCLVVLDADTGKLAWYAQQEKHDVHDWDTAAAPMLYEKGGRNYVSVGSKDAELYIYDRDSHALVAKKTLTRRVNDTVPLFAGKDVHVCPGSTGGVQWNGPAYHPGLGMIFVNTVDWCTTYKSDPAKAAMFGGSMTMDPPEQARGALLAFDATTGAQKWVYHASAPMLAGVTPTAGGVVLTGSSDGDFLVFDGRTGDQLYSFYTGGAVAGGTTTYMVDGKQYVAVLSGNSSKALWKTSGAATLVVFALP
jgi:PQQ-dependent dehydrogenase (methanol/ethanol family)